MTTRYALSLAIAITGSVWPIRRSKADHRSLCVVRGCSRDAELLTSMLREALGLRAGQ